MSGTARTIIGVIVAVLVVVLLGLVYIWVSGGGAAPSATLSAPTLDLSTKAATTAPTAAPATAAATEEESGADATEAADDTEAVTVATGEATSEAVVASASTAEAPPGNFVVFNIETDDSEVRFILDELLRGSPNTVTGRTDQIAGQLAVDFSNPQNSQVGEIRISARSLATDNELRNRAIRSVILQSAEDQFEFISFVPTSIDGLPTSITMGEAFEFELTGDLTIRDITQSVTFDVTVTPVSESKIEGTATATIQRADYNLEIPSVPSVAAVDEAVRLEIDFTAVAAT